MADNEGELADYDDDNQAKNGSTKTDAPGTSNAKGSYAGIHSSSFKDFLLKPEINKAIADCGYEHPSEVQHECIPQAILGMDIICQAKPGMGKTAVFVISTLHQLETEAEGKNVSVLVLCNTRELAFQIHSEYIRFSKYLKDVVCSVFYGGIPISKDIESIKKSPPNIVIGTPGRIKQLVLENKIDISKVDHFVLDECDQMLADQNMRGDVQTIFMKTPHSKQVMMFSATLPQEIRPVCKKFTQDPLEVYVDDDKLTLHGLQQFYVELTEAEKNRKLTDLLDNLDFKQIIIFTSKVNRATELSRLLNDCQFPTMVIHSGMVQEERQKRIDQFKNFQSRILVSTDLMGRGIDVERVNIVINYDMSDGADQYLHRVNRAGRFGTKGLAISFISSPADKEVLENVQKKFAARIPTLPEKIDPATYTAA